VNYSIYLVIFIAIVGMGISPRGPHQGNVGVMGIAGKFKDLASELRLPNEMI